MKIFLDRCCYLLILGEQLWGSTVGARARLFLRRALGGRKLRPGDERLRDASYAVSATDEARVGAVHARQQQLIWKQQRQQQGLHHSPFLRQQNAQLADRRQIGRRRQQQQRRPTK